MTFVVAILRRAQRDVEQIREWLGVRSPKGAAGWYAAFEEATAGLKQNPERFPEADDCENLDYIIRQSFFKTRRGRMYRILFTIAGHEVRVLRVRGPGQAPATEEDLGS